MLNQTNYIILWIAEAKACPLLKMYTKKVLDTVRHLVTNSCIKFTFRFFSLHLLANIPNFMKNAERIVGGEVAPDPIQWQVSIQTQWGFSLLWWYNIK